MNDKFTMELVWHNCKTHPPKEFENNSLIITDGNDVFGVSWNVENGYYISYDDGDMELSKKAYGDWYWTDIKQTVQGESRFKT